MDTENTIISISDKIYIKELKKTLPAQHNNNVSKLIKKLQIAAFNQDFKTSFNKDKTLMTFAKLDYNRSDFQIDRKFDFIDELILNAIYSFTKAGHTLFTSRKLLQHIFGNCQITFKENNTTQLQ